MSTETPAFTWLLSWQLDQEHPTVLINEEDETVSYATFTDHPESFVIFEGRLFDKHNFRIPQSATDAERILEYYNIFDEDLFIKLRGGFSLVIWDAAKHCLIAGRDHMGQIPLYYNETNSGIAISSSAISLLQQPNINKSVNRLVIAEYLLGFYPDHQMWETFFSDISRLPPAHFLKRTEQHSSFSRYWDPLPIGIEWASKEEESALIDLFQQAVQRCLSVGADSISLSGGIDSCSIAAMAAKIQSKRGGNPLHAISGKFPGTGVDDGQIQKTIAQSLGMTQTLLAPEEILPGTSVIQASLDRSAFSPLPNLNPLESTFSVQMRIASNGMLSKMMLGTGGDEMFLVDYSWLPDLFNSRKFFKLFNFLQMMDSYLSGSDISTARKKSLKSTTRYIAKSILDQTKNYLIGSKQQIHSFQFPLWLSNSDKFLLDEISHRHQETLQDKVYPGEGSYIISMREMIQEAGHINFLEHRYFHARQENFFNLYPYLDPDLIQLAYRIPPERKFNNNLVKSHLQQFLRENNLIDSLPIQKTDYMPLLHHLMRTEGKQAWHTSTGGRELAELNIINQAGIENLMSDYFSSRNNAYSFTWRILSAEAWLHIYSIKN